MIDRSLFSPSFKATMGPDDFEHLMEMAESVPFLESDLNQYLAKGGLITEGPGNFLSQNGSEHKIFIDKNDLNGSRNSEPYHFETLCLTLGHEATHGLENFDLKRNAPNPVESGRIAVEEEGRALDAEARISHAFGGVPLKIPPHEQALLEALTQEKGLSLDVREEERVQLGAEIYGRQRSSAFGHLTVADWYPAQKAFSECSMGLTPGQMRNVEPGDIQLTVDENDPKSWKISADLPSDPEAPWACTKLRGEFNADGPVSVQAETDLPALPSLNLKDFNECDRFSSALKSEGVSLSPSQWNNIKEDDISVEKESRPP